MKQTKPEMVFGKMLITLGCVYESVALWTRLPTITSLNHHGWYHPKLRYLALLWVVLWVHHFVPQVQAVVSVKR